MSNQWFQFRHFMVRQDRCAMKVGTDGVLLGAWAPLAPGRPVLDVGTGTGLVALIAAQRMLLTEIAVPHEALVTGIEIDSEAALQAKENFAASPWSEYMMSVCADVNCFRPERHYASILCNPPFFKDSLRCPDSRRNVARHGDSLSYDSLGKSVSGLLEPDGLFSAIVPSDNAQAFIHAMAANGLYAVHRTDVITTAGKAPKRTLLSFALTPVLCRNDSITMFDSGNFKTPEYARLVNSIYL